MDKYRTLFYKQMRERLGLLSAEGNVPERELYRLVHSIKGTAGTIGLTDWMEAAERQLPGLREDSEREWSAGDRASVLSPFLHLLPAAAPEAPAEGIGPAAGSDGEGSLALPAAERRQDLVVVLDDDPGMLTVLKDALEAGGWMALATPYPDRALEWCYDLDPDCVVLDVVLQQSSGLELLGRIRERCEARLIPTVLMSARNDKATRIAGFGSGADDFIPKPFALDEFTVRIGRQLSRRRRLTAMLMNDELTGAYNAPFFRQELERWRSLPAGGPPLTVSLFNLDDFRGFNEREGYARGDQALREFSHIIRNALREQDVWAREKGDRFLLLQPGMTETETEDWIGGLLARYGRSPDGMGGLPSFSAGITRADPASPVASILERAASAAAEAKAAGGGRAAVYREDTPAAKPPLRVAVIDDDDLIRSLLLRQLRDLAEEYGAEIRVFSDGEDFFGDGWSEGGGRCLLILDRMMPRMNGMEVLRKLRGLTGQGEYKVLMLTGVQEEREIAEAIQAGTDDYLTKPFSLVELEARVGRLLRGMSG